MSELSLKSLGFTKTELQNRVIDKLCEQVLVQTDYDEYGDPHDNKTSFAVRLEKQVKELVDARVEAAVDEHLSAGVEEFINTLVLEETNNWGEKSGQKWTIVEYIVKKVELFMQEKVDYEGRPQSQYRGSSWRPENTRVGYMVAEHLNFHIKEAVTKMLADANSQIVGGIEKAVMIQLDKIKNKIKVTVGK